MSTSTVILGESGSGKSASLRNLDPADTLLIQAIRKPLPFRTAGWKPFDKVANPAGNVFVSDHWETIIGLARKTKRKRIVIDDFQYILANEFMRRTDERGFDKFTDIGKHAWEIIMAMNELAPDVRVYLLSHTAQGDDGKTRMKTIGKMLDEKITLEGLFTIVLRTEVADGEFVFRTRNSGSDTTKAPIGMFDTDRVPNDLAEVDKAIVSYYGLEPQPTTIPQKAA
jgi:hypothetical protein